LSSTRSINCSDVLEMKTTKKVAHEKSLVEELLPDNYNDSGQGLKRKQSKKRRRLEERAEQVDSETQFVAFQERYEIDEEERNNRKFQVTGKDSFTEDVQGSDSSEEEQEEEEDLRSLGSKSVVDGEDYGLTEEEERCLQLFENQNYFNEDGNDSSERPTLASLILQRLEEYEQSKRKDTQSLSETTSTVPPNVRELYFKVGEVLKHYSSGKLPKAVKMLPSIANWHQLLSYTRPSEWSTASVYAMTRLFIANLKSNEAQRFCSWILLPRIHEDILKRKKLNFHLYQSLKKALFKPEAFFKGIIFPLCESGECTAREATILGSVLLKSSIPLLHSASCLLKLSSFSYSPAVVIFIRILLEKKYALPSKVIDGVCRFFLSKQLEKSQRMPVLWHHALLVFTRFYHDSFSVEQKKQLRSLVTKQAHPGITPEIKSILALSDNSVKQGKDDFMVL